MGAFTKIQGTIRQLDELMTRHETHRKKLLDEPEVIAANTAKKLGIATPDQLNVAQSIEYSNQVIEQAEKTKSELEDLKARLTENRVDSIQADNDAQAIVQKFHEDMPEVPNRHVSGRS